MAKETIEYKCVDCGNIFEADKKKHLDAAYYFECGCGESAMPLHDEDLETMDSK